MCEVLTIRIVVQNSPRVRLELLEVKISRMKDLVGVFERTSIDVENADIFAERFRILQVRWELVRRAFVCE